MCTAQFMQAAVNSSSPCSRYYSRLIQHDNIPHHKQQHTQKNMKDEDQGAPATPFRDRRQLFVNTTTSQHCTTLHNIVLHTTAAHQASQTVHLAHRLQLCLQLQLLVHIQLLRHMLLWLKMTLAPPGLEQLVLLLLLLLGLIPHT
jgi:hypothetical protein